MSSIPASLTAAAPATLELSAEIQNINAERRTITGLLVPAGDTVGNTSAGPTLFTFGSVTWHPELRRVKLLREHQRVDSIGYAVELSWQPIGLVGTFYVPPSPEGDRALTEARNGIRDGLSVGVDALVGSVNRDGVLIVTGSNLRETSLVSVPAFTDSRVTVVATNTKGNRMFTAAELAALAAAGIDPTDARARTYLDSLTAAGFTVSAREPNPQQPQQPQQPANDPANREPQQLSASAVLDELMDRLRSGQLAPVSTPPQLGGPNTAPGQAQASGRELSLSAFAQLVASHESGDPASAVELRAALTDVIPSDNPGAFRPTYLTELWEGAAYTRQFIDVATTVRPLGRTMKIIGQRWETAPVVDDYAGDKGAVPSGDAKLVDIPVDVGRLAGAHDVDRAYIDLGSPEWLVSYFDAQSESVKKKSDAKAAALVKAGATAITGGPFATLMEGVIAGVVEAAGVGEPVSYVAMAPGLIAELLGLTRDEVPAYLSGGFRLTGGDGTLGDVAFVTALGLTGADFMLGNKGASRWHENNPPIRVQAINVANGGVDLGVFSYYAGYVRNPAGVRKGTVSA